MHCFPGDSKGSLCPCLLWVGEVCFLVRFSPLFLVSPKTASCLESDPSYLRNSGQRTELACLLYSPKGLSCNWPELWSLPLLISWGDSALWHSPCRVKKKWLHQIQNRWMSQSKVFGSLSKRSHLPSVTRKESMLFQTEL